MNRLDSAYCITFKGIVENESILPTTANPGDLYVVADSDSEYLFSGNDFVKLDSTELTTSIPSNCPNCGAIVRGSSCEYCGTEFYHSFT